VSVDLATARASVTYDPEALSVDDLCGVVAAAGYEAAPLASGSPVS
jgi:copper chaperone CopZ